MFEDIFHRRKLNIEKLQSFGFEMRMVALNILCLL